MKKTLMGLTAAFAMLTASGAFAQDTLIDHLMTACETDLANYCSQVTPGEGRLLHCMAAHEDKISGQCEYAFYQAATLLEQLAVAISYVAQECRADIEAHCGNVEIGDGKILACLEDHSEDVSDACKTAVNETVNE
jgi:hypothetical protein